MTEHQNRSTGFELPEGVPASNHIILNITDDEIPAPERDINITIEGRKITFNMVREYEAVNSLEDQLRWLGRYTNHTEQQIIDLDLTIQEIAELWTYLGIAINQKTKAYVSKIPGRRS